MHSASRISLALPFVLGVAACGASSDVAHPDVTDVAPPDVTRVGTITQPDSAASLAETQSCGPNNICYSGGQVLHTPPVYLIWYGTSWQPGQQTIVTDFLSNVSGSVWAQILTTYGDSTGPASSDIVFDVGQATAPYVDCYSSGQLLDIGFNGDFPNILRSALDTGAFPTDPNALYVILTDPTVTLKDFNGCGYHWYTTQWWPSLHYAVVPIIRGCENDYPPNGDEQADGAVNVLGHELTESITDPELSTWLDTVTGEELADKCAGEFGRYGREIYETPNAIRANLHLGARDYFLQELWVAEHGGYCSMYVDPQRASVEVYSAMGGASVTAADRRTCTSHCYWSFPSGATTTLTATPPSGYGVAWHGCDSTSGKDCSLSISGDRTVSVTYPALSCPIDQDCYNECMSNCVLGYRPACNSSCRSQCKVCP